MHVCSYVRTTNDHSLSWWRVMRGPMTLREMLYEVLNSWLSSRAKTQNKREQLQSFKQWNKLITKDYGGWIRLRKAEMVQEVAPRHYNRINVRLLQFHNSILHVSFQVCCNGSSWNQVCGLLPGKSGNTLNKLTPSAFSYTLIFFPFQPNFAKPNGDSEGVMKAGFWWN